MVVVLGACASAPPSVPSALPPPPAEPEAPAPWLSAEVTLPEPSRSEPSTRGALVPTGLRGRVVDARWAPDGASLAVVTNEKLVGLVDARTGDLRAARRVLVFRESNVRIEDFDGDRLLLSYGAYGEDEGAIVWDLVADAWQVLTEQGGAGCALTPTGAIVRDEEEGTFEHVDHGGERVTLGPGERAHAVGAHAVIDEGEGVTVVALPVVGEHTARRIGRVAGSFAALRARGGLVATREGDLVRVARLADAAVVLERPFEGLREVSWDRQDHFVVEVEREGSLVRHRFDGARGEPIDVVSVAHREPDDLTIGDAVLTVDGDGTIERRALDGTVAARLREPFGDDVELEYDPISGEELGRALRSPSPDETRVLLHEGSDLHVIDVADGRVVVTVPRDDSGATSVWGVVATPRGAVVWGRSHVSHWGPRGAHVFECRGSGFFFGDDDSPGWSNGNATCVGERRGEWPMWDAENGLPAWVAGPHGDGLLVLSAGQFLHVDARTLRATRRMRAPTDFALDCYEEGCEARSVRLGRGAWLHGASGGLVDATGRLRTFDAENATFVGGERVWVLDGTRSRVLDASGRVVREGAPAASLAALSPDGGWIARGNDDGVVVVERTDDGAEVVRIEASLTGIRELRERALLGVDDEGLYVWHLPTGAARGRFAPGTQVTLDASGDRLAVCTEGRLELHSVADGRRAASLGECELADSIAFVASDRFVAVRSRTQVTFFRLADGRRLVVHGAGESAFAEDGDRVFATSGAERGLRWRAPGAITTATMSAIDDRLDPTLVARFFAP